MSKLWKIAPRLSEDLIEHLLLSRGFKTKTDREQYFSPQKKDYLESLKIPHLAKAQKIIKEVIAKKGLIVIYGDYDVDGICATAIGYLGLTSIEAKVLPYIPHRDKEGYGLSKTGIDWAKEQGAELIITVDTGIVAFEQVDYIKQLGMQIIITDHHVALDKLPQADAIIHSTQMCGAGVIWSLLDTMILPENSEQLLELVAIATVCDMMILQNVNRWFVREGIERLKVTQRVGLLALANECGVIMREISTYHIGHIFGPRLNAIGRLEHAIDALRLICTPSPRKAVELAKLLVDTNSVKKQLSNDAIYEAKVVVDQLLKDQKSPRIIVVHSPKWVPGIIGLVAARLADEYHLPTIVISEGESQSKASARTSNGVNIVETIRKCSDLLIDVGGHPAAAGFTIANENIELFKKQIDQAIDEIKEEYVDELIIDFELPQVALNQRLIDQLLEFEPFGLGNEKPILATTNMIVSDLRTVGEGKHLKLKLNNIDGIAFGKGDLASLLDIGMSVNVAYYLELNKFNGREMLQLNIVDLQIN